MINLRKQDKKIVQDLIRKEIQEGADPKKDCDAIFEKHFGRQPDLYLFRRLWEDVRLEKDQTPADDEPTIEEQVENATATKDRNG